MDFSCISFNHTPFFCLCFSCIKSLPRRRSVGLCWMQLYAGWPPRMSCSYNRKMDQNRTFKEKETLLPFFLRCGFSAVDVIPPHCKVPKAANISFCALHSNSNYRKSHILCLSSLFFTYLFMGFTCLFSGLHFLCNC